MKKIIALVLAMMMVLLAFASCAKNTDEVVGENGETVKTEKLNLATGGTTGTYYGYGSAIATVINGKTDKIDLVPASTGASKANIQLLQLGEADIALVQNDVMYYAMTGTDLFEADGVMDKFKAVAGLYSETCQIVVKADSGIDSVADLKDKRVSVGDAGSGVEFNARQILKAYGLDADKDIKKTNASFGDSAEALNNGSIDAFFVTAGEPTTAVSDLATKQAIKLVPIEAEKLSSYGYYAAYTIPADTYAGVDEAVDTVAVKATVIARDEVSEEAVYEFLTQLFANKEEITTSHAKGQFIDPVFAVDAIANPFHKGAVKFFTEIFADNADYTLTFDENNVATVTAK